MKNVQALKDVVHRIDKEGLSYSIAAKISGYTANHVRAMHQKYKVVGDAAFIHGNKGKKPVLTIPGPERQKIVQLYKKECAELNFCTFCDVMEEFYDMHYCKRTVYNILTEAGIVSPEKRRKAGEKIHRPRSRRANEGDLLQVDATPFDWFGDGHMYALHGAVDDATSKFTGLYMCENECLYGYFELVRQTFYMEGGGHPAEIYSDRAAIFCYPPRDADKMTMEEQLAGYHERKTQWQRMLKEVHVKQILAFSPQAKGRVERAWRTVQATLPWRLQRLGIKTIEDANVYIRDVYLPWYNKKYGKEPQSPVKVYHKSYLDPDYVLSARTSRHTNSAGVFSFEGYKWQLHKPRAACVDFELCVNEHGIRAWKDGKWYEVSLLEDIQEVEGENCPKVLKNIIYKYMYKNGHHH